MRVFADGSVRVGGDGCGVWFCGACAAGSGGGKDNRTIAITTTDSVDQVADQADVSVGFETYGNDEDSTYADGSRLSSAITKALTDAGVKAEDISSQQQNLAPINDTDKVRWGKGIRFRLTQSWTATTAAKNAANVLHVAALAGANDSGNIAWKLSDSAHDAVEAQASAKALAHARVVADRMAAGLAIKLGPLVYASNQQPTRAVAPVYAAGFYGGRVMAESKAAAPLVVTPQKISISATIYAVFSIE